MTREHDLPSDLETRADELLRGRPNADLLAGMTTNSFEASGLDHDTLVLVWLAALVALDAPSDPDVLNLGAASANGVSPERVHQVLTALAPIVGTPRIMSATSKVAGARISGVIRDARLARGACSQTTGSRGSPRCSEKAVMN